MQGHLPLLTSIRGFAAFFVALFHTRLVLFPQWKENIANTSQLLENGYLWVDIFFILSGFVMMHVYRNSFQQGCTMAKWRHFMWLRFSRIYPLFLMTLLFLLGWESIKHVYGIGFYGGELLNSWGLAGIPAFQGPFNTSDTLFANLFLLQSLTSQALSWNFPGWSLSVEWLCYMMFPIILALLSFNAKRSSWLPILVFFLLYGLISTTGTIDLTSGIPAFLRGLCGFSLGAWMCLIRIPHNIKRFISNDWVLFALVISLVLLLHHKLGTGQILSVYLLFALLVFCGANHTQNTSLFMRLFDNKLTQYLGDISYSVYLWHSVLLLIGVEVINQLAPEFTLWWYQQSGLGAFALALALYTVVLLTISTASYHLLEKPALRQLRSLQITKLATRIKKTSKTNSNNLTTK
ncbi:acyltransferase family protein [Photobacterium sanguinicancri]|uniref:acyltransferase family protein n=1 Tax=Photobacterium sanguinicancri TaxID=875932 RepID=UPI0021C336C3|nr:acyltransferase [Photobacterium sanguinicancri]